jgi:hypothetical protein
MTALVPSSVKPDTKTDQDHPNQGGVCNYSCFTLFFTVYRLRKKVSREQIQEDARCLFSNISEETQIFLFPRGCNLQQSNATWRYGGSHTSTNLKEIFLQSLNKRHFYKKTRIMKAA